MNVMRKISECWAYTDSNNGVRKISHHGLKDASVTVERVVRDEEGFFY